MRNLVQRSEWRTLLWDLGRRRSAPRRRCLGQKRFGYGDRLERDGFLDRSGTGELGGIWSTGVGVGSEVIRSRVVQVSVDGAVESGRMV